MPSVLDDFVFPPRSVGAITIRNVNVVPMDSERVLVDQAVTIESGQITAVADTDGSESVGAHDIDGTGLFLMPGLADMHVHLPDPTAFGMFLANGVTQVRNMSGEPTNLAFEQHVQSGKLPGPHVVTTSPIVDGPDERGLTVWPRCVFIDDPDDAIRLVRRFVDRGYHQIKTYSWLRLETLQAIGRAAADLGIRVTGHCPEGVSNEQAMDAGMSCFEHLMSIAVNHHEPGKHSPEGRSMAGSFGLDAMRLIAYHLDFDAIRRLGGQLAARQVWNCPTTVTWQGQIGDITDLARDRLRYERPAAIPQWNVEATRTRLDLQGPTDEWRIVNRARVEAHLNVISILHQEGAPLLLGTDAHTPWVFEGFSVHDEVENFIEAGLSPFEALSCGTREAARFLDQEGDWGTITPGSRADLILSDANPLDDPATLRHPRAMFTNGYYLTRSDLDQLLETRARLAHRPLAEPAQPAAPPAARSAADGRMIDYDGAQEAGRLRYRHSSLQDGSWLVEEDYVGHAEAGDLTQHCRWWLTSDFVLSHGECATKTALGTDAYNIRRTNGGYDLLATEIDGRQDRHRIDAPAVIPVEPFAKTAWSLVLRYGVADRTMAKSVGYLNGEPTVDEVSLQACGEATDGPGTSSWELVLTRPGSTVTRQVHLSSSGVIRRIEQSGWSGERRLEADTATRWGEAKMPNRAVD